MTWSAKLDVPAIINSTGIPKGSDHPKRVKETDAALRDNHFLHDMLRSSTVTIYDSTCGPKDELPTSTE